MIFHRVFLISSVLNKKVELSALSFLNIDLFFKINCLSKNKVTLNKFL